MVFQEMHAEDPYEAMAEKMVYCIYNGSVKQRIEKAERLARINGIGWCCFICPLGL